MGIKSLKTVPAARSLLTSVPFPELPSCSGVLPVPLVDTPVVHRHAGNDKGDHDQGLERLGDDRTTQKKQAYAAEDDRGGDPCPVGAF